MKLHKALIFVLVVTLLISAAPALPAGAAPPTPNQQVRQLVSRGTTSFTPATAGSGELQWPEFPAASGVEGFESGGALSDRRRFVNRSFSQGRQGQGSAVSSANKAGSNPGLVTSFDGLNHRQQRLANSGNQFSLEPPDQGLCVGNGFVLESVNSALRVYDTRGTARTGVLDLNTFYGYPAAINRTTGEVGPFVFDPSCYFDQPTRRWFQVVLTLDVVPSTGAYTGKNHLDIAVSRTADPTGLWNLYSLPVQNDGTDGTPNHGCSLGPCLGDYPHIGADKYGFYITTNEYSLFGIEYKSAQIYAISKKALASGAASPTVVQFDTTAAVAGNPGFTVWPAVAPGNRYASDLGGTEYFLSSMAAEEANGTGTDSRVAIWALTNTGSLDSGGPALALSNSIIAVNTYGLPPQAEQKPGDFPLGQCIDDNTSPTPYGPGCWRFFFSRRPPPTEVESHLDSNDTRMQQVVYADGKLWGALDTVVNVGGAAKAGIAWYVIRPGVSLAGVAGTVVKQGYLALANNNLSYPAVAVLPNGKGVIGFTLVGNDYYPSAAYAALDASAGAGDIHIAAVGLGPDDGFTSYKAFVGNPPRTRWGDYGAAVADGNSIWIASEYIAQSCTLGQYMAAPFGSCGGTRTSLGNWATRISQVTP